MYTVRTFVVIECSPRDVQAAAAAAGLPATTQAIWFEKTRVMMLNKYNPSASVYHELQHAAGDRLGEPGRMEPAP
jgi:hypothetical protein